MEQSSLDTLQLLNKIEIEFCDNRVVVDGQLLPLVGVYISTII